MSAPQDDAARQPKDGVLTHQTSTPSSENEAGPAGNDPSAIGVSRVEAFNKVLYQSGKAGKTWLWMLGISVGLTMFAYALDMGITYSIFTTLAASTFGTHSSLAAVNTASQIIRAISKPFIGKLADITSRPTTYVVVLFFYVVGFAVAASASDFASYTVGICFTSVGKSGLDLLSDIIVGDLTPLQWRGFFSACLSLPFVVTVPINGFITDGFIDNWRWGLGMFAILVPVLLLPAIFLLYAMQRRGEKMGMVTMADSKNVRVEGAEKASWFILMKNGLVDIDIGGLIILGAAFALILLPFTLAEEMSGGWSNGRVIAMLVVGFVLLAVFALYERFVSPKPVMSKRIMNNRTFLAAVFIYTFNQMASSVRNTYYSSYIYVVKPWTPYQWTIFLGVTTMGLSLLGPVVGLLQRKTHRYKSLMVFGSVARLVGYGILVQPDGHMVQDTARLLASQLIFCLGAFNVVGARVGSQASVPHEDMASLISLLTLWSTLGSSIGSAISSAIWTREMVPRMKREMPGVDDSVIASIYKSITVLRTDYDFNDPIRRGSIRAYAFVNGHIATTALSLCFVPLIAGLFMPDFFLGRQQNAVTNTGLDNEAVDVPKRPVEDGKSVSFLRRLANAYYRES